MSVNGTKVLVLRDKDGVVIRYCTFQGGQEKERIMNEWKRLYANNKSFQQAVFSVEQNDYADLKKPKK